MAVSMSQNIIYYFHSLNKLWHFSSQIWLLTSFTLNILFKLLRLHWFNFWYIALSSLSSVLTVILGWYSLRIVSQINILWYASFDFVVRWRKSLISIGDDFGCILQFVPFKVYFSRSMFQNHHNDHCSVGKITQNHTEHDDCPLIQKV